MIFKNHFNSTPDPGETNNQASETVPNQCMSIEEIIKRSYAGLTVNEARVPFFSEDPENDLLQGVNPSTLDISELEDLKLFAAERIKILKDQAKADHKARQEADKAAVDQKTTEFVEVIKTKLNKEKPDQGE